jgi:hypothetical protein
MSMFEPISSARHAATNYIAYILNDDGRIRGAEWIAATDDADALAQVQRLNLAAQCELWQRDRKIGAVGPGRS